MHVFVVGPNGAEIDLGEMSVLPDRGDYLSGADHPELRQRVTARIFQQRATWDVHLDDLDPVVRQSVPCDGPPEWVCVLDLSERSGS